MKEKRFKVILMILAGIAAFSAVIMLLWNGLLPGLFAFPHINFWQALGLLVLTRLLFGRFGFRGWSEGHAHRNHIREKWEKMTPEERRDFVRNHRHRRFLFGDGLLKEEQNGYEARTEYADAEK